MRNGLNAVVICLFYLEVLLYNGAIDVLLYNGGIDQPIGWSGFSTCMCIG